MSAYAGTNRRGGRGRYTDARPRSFFTLLPDRDPDIAVGMKYPVLQLWKVPQANPTAWNNVQPIDLTPIASYNWTNNRNPTIIVPGCPPIWQNKPTPFKVPRDSGRGYIDQNRVRMPLYPLLPAFVAIEHMQPSFDYASLDIITDRNNLRKLLRWIENTADKEFRIDLQLCGPKTVILGRWESKPVEMNPERLGFGLNFERYTTRLLVGCEKSTGHHRIVSYNYGDLKMLVRFEVDACVINDAQTQLVPDDMHRSRLTQSLGPDDFDLASAMSTLSLSSQTIDETIDSDDSGPEIGVIPAGKFVPQESLAELSTKSLRSMDSPHNSVYRGGQGRGRTEVPEPDWDYYFPQLFVSGTPHHKFAVHEHGQFRRVYERTLRDDVLRQHLKTQQHAFDKLRVVLGRIIEIVKEKGKDARLSLVYKVDGNRMELCERTSSMSCLPKAWLQKFEPLGSFDPGEEADSPQSAGTSEDTGSPTDGVRQDDGRDQLLGVSANRSPASNVDNVHSDDEKRVISSSSGDLTA